MIAPRDPHSRAGGPDQAPWAVCPAVLPCPAACPSPPSPQESARYLAGLSRRLRHDFRVHGFVDPPAHAEALPALPAPALRRSGRRLAAGSAARPPRGLVWQARQAGTQRHGPVSQRGDAAVPGEALRGRLTQPIGAWRPACLGFLPAAARRPACSPAAGTRSCSPTLDAMAPDCKRHPPCAADDPSGGGA